MVLPPLGAVVDHRIFGLFLLIVSLLSACRLGGIDQEYPGESLNFIVPWEAGTPEGQVSMFFASALENELDYPVEIVNTSPVDLLVGHSDLAQSNPDGHTLGVIGAAITIKHWTGVTPLDISRYSPIALFAVNPPVITVHREASWKSIHDLVNALDTNPEALTASGTYSGGIWDLDRIGFLESVGLESSALVWQPSPDVASALEELLAGNVDVVISTLSEVDSLRKADRVRSLAVMSDHRLSTAPDIPTLVEYEIAYTSAGSWLALAAPEDLPDVRLEFLRTIVWKLSQKSTLRRSIEKSGLQFRYLTGSTLDSFLAEEDSHHGTLLRKAGLALEK